MWSRLTRGIGIGASTSGICLALLCGSCSWLERESPTQPRSQIAPATDFTVVAVPLYRLVASRAVLDSPSRLIAVQVRIEGVGDTYAFAPGDLSIQLPDGRQARIFDQPRASALLARTLVADADMSYLLRPGHLPGGMGTFASEALAEMVQRNLLGPGTFGPGQPLQGYVVIDTGQALMTLDGASFAAIARRLGDDVPARYAYQIAPTSFGETGTP